MKKLIVKSSLFLKKDEEKAKIDMIKKAWKEDNFVVIPAEFSYEVVDDNIDVLKQAREEIRKLDDINPDYPMDRTIHVSRNEVLEILDKLIAESEG